MSIRFRCFIGLAILVAALPSFGIIRYVDGNSTNATPPYTNWSTAANVIQDAVDAADPGDQVFVTNGVYSAGGRAVHGLMTNRVAVNKPLMLLGVSGPESTVIEGYQVPGTTHGDGAIRCVYLTNGAFLSGFTLTNGATRDSGEAHEQTGGGLWCESLEAVASNCVVAGNMAKFEGGGAYSGTLRNCWLVGNRALWGGGSAGSAVEECSLVGNSAAESGGGAFWGTLSNSTLDGNSASGSGGGSYAAGLNGCLVTNNSAGFGGGAHSGSLINCTVVANTASQSGGGTSLANLENCILGANSAVGAGGGSSQDILSNCTIAGNSAAYGGGFYFGTMKNCIVYGNTASVQGDNHYFFLSMDYSCTTPETFFTTGNITNAPLFVDANDWSDLRLQSNSPCINAGNNGGVATTNDLDGGVRIAGGTVDMGAYEFQSPQSIVSYAWLQQYDLPIDGTADDIDSDSDSHNTWQEWKAWTDPTNKLSVLKLLMPEYAGSGLLLRWNGESGAVYQVERTSDLDPLTSFGVLQTNIPGQPGNITFRDTSMAGGGSAFYRIRSGSTNLGSPILMDLPEFVPAEVTVRWQSVAGHAYSLERTTNPAAPYTVLQSSIVGLHGTTSYIDTNAVGEGPFFYRVGVPE